MKFKRRCQLEEEEATSVSCLQVPEDGKAISPAPESSKRVAHTAIDLSPPRYLAQQITDRGKGNKAQWLRQPDNCNAHWLVAIEF
jgi:translation initiation factor 2B subunit (eIF-2B alpha/beta/delta family)